MTVKRRSQLQESGALVNAYVRNSTGVLELNRPRALNSLNQEMIDIIDEALKEWKDDDAVHRVLLTSLSEKGFCAGGDVRVARDAALSGNHDPADRFFATEFVMNGDLAEFPKPYVSLIDGVVMGGGLGISAHGSHRVITERAFAAMPEMAIGYMPDVGIPWMFQHMVGETGKPSYALAVFLVVTGWRLSPADMLYSGLATHFVSSENLSDFTDMLIAESLDEALERFAEEGPTDSKLKEYAADIEATFGYESWEHIDRALKKHPNQEFVADVNKHLESANPASVVAAVELMHAVTKCASIREELELERVLGAHMRREPNFAEGVRAVLVDKDRSPSFHPATFDAVDESIYRALLTSVLNK